MIKMVTRSRLSRRLRLLSLLAMSVLVSTVSFYPASGVSYTWQNLGPAGGYFKGWAASADSSVIIAGSDDSGGIWKSTNSGSSWTLKTGTALHNACGWMVTMDSVNQNLLYAADAYGRIPLLKSTDLGETWTQMTGFPQLRANSVAINPDNHNILYAGTGMDDSERPGDGVWKSTNGGQTWSRVGLAGLAATCIRAKSGGYVFAAGSAGVYRSTNSGSTWSLLSGLPAVTCTALTVASNGDIWAGFFGPSSAAIYKSTNNGSSWTAKGLNGAAIFDIAVDKDNPQIVYVANLGVGVMKTTNGGSSWTAKNSGIESKWVISIFQAPNKYLFCSNYGNTGIYRSTNQGDSWSNVLTGLNSFYASGISFDPNDPAKIFAPSLGSYTADPNAVTNRTKKGVISGTGITWSNLKTTPSQDYSVSVKYGDSNTICYGTWDKGFYWTSNGGTTFTHPVTSGVCSATVFDPDDINVCMVSYLSLTDFTTKIYRTANSGASWTAINVPFQGLINQLYCETNNSPNVWACTSDGVYKSTDNGLTWSAVEFQGYDVACIVEDPLNGNVFYVGGQDQLFYTTTDGGYSWQPVTHPTWPEGTCVRALTMDPDYSTRLYVGLDGAEKIMTNTDCKRGGVWQRINGVWTEITGNLVCDHVRGLQFHVNNSQKYLYVGTYGGSVSRLPIN